MLQVKVLRRLLAAAGLWMTASAATAAPSPAAMPLGQVALPPVGYVDFCQRRPQDCGDDAGAVLVAARRAESDRMALLGGGAQAAPAALQAPSPAILEAVATPLWTLQPAPELASALVERAESPGPVAFVDPAARTVAIRSAPAMTPDLWAKLNRVNTQVNAAIRRETDAATWGRDDYWATPLQDGRAAGDCEDFVLEKRRALIEAGVPAAALNIAVVTTTWGETHAVLLVDTNKGEFVLDNLSSWVVPWKQAPYRWRQRQVDGEAFSWVMAAMPRPDKGSRHGRGLLIAAL